jgi:hypothetical protein
MTSIKIIERKNLLLRRKLAEQLAKDKKKTKS